MDAKISNSDEMKNVLQVKKYRNRAVPNPTFPKDTANNFSSFRHVSYR